jgi:hypothetical protein
MLTGRRTKKDDAESTFAVEYDWSAEITHIRHNAP